MKLQKPDRKHLRKLIQDNVVWLLGCSIYSIALNCFAVPNNIAQSGVSGLAIVGNYLAPVLSLGIWNFLLNVPLLIAAYFKIGKAFVAKTLWVILILSVSLDLWGKVLPPYQGDRILAALFCGVLSGIGLAVVLMTGATSGGTDIVGRLIHQKWPHISLGKVMLAFDGCVVTLAAVVFRSFESALYAVIVIYVSTKVIDTINYGMGNGKMLMIISDKGEEIASAITRQTPRGVTLVPVEGAYSGTSKKMLVCVVRSHEMQRFKKIINEVDPHTFIIVSEANEIWGKGFKKSI